MHLLPLSDPLRFHNHVAVLDMHRKRLDDNGARDLNAYLVPFKNVPGNLFCYRFLRGEETVVNDGVVTISHWDQARGWVVCTQLLYLVLFAAHRGRSG